MGRILALDLGRKRCGVAVTDPLQLIANGLTVVSPSLLDNFLSQYFDSEQVDEIVVGNPRRLDGQQSESWQYISPILNRLRTRFPSIPFILFDERFTSTLAHKAMIEGGMKKSHRQIKDNADIMAATILLNDYLETKKYKMS